MRLLTYNIHGCVGRRGVIDPGAVLAVIREADADVVALQEVHEEEATDRSFLRALERDLDYPFLLHGPTMRKAEADYGNVLLSRHRPVEEERIDLSFPGREPRGAIRVRLEEGGRRFDITATHLGLHPGERRDQLRRLTERIPGEDADPIQILMGDLNEWLPWSRAARLLRSRFGGFEPLRTFPARLPLFALDRIHVRPHSVRVCRRLLESPSAREASDHLPLVADLEFP